MEIVQSAFFLIVMSIKFTFPKEVSKVNLIVVWQEFRCSKKSLNSSSPYVQMKIPALCKVPVYNGKETHSLPKGKCPFSLENRFYTVLRKVYSKFETFSLSHTHTNCYSFSPIWHL